MEKETIQLDFEKMGGLVPAVVQDDVTQKVLMVGFMNEAAFHKTLDTNRDIFQSDERSIVDQRRTKRKFLRGEIHSTGL